jgi:hypothetical protein
MFYCPCPEGINTGDFALADRIGERPGANAVDIAAIINQMAGRFDGQLGAGIPGDVIHRAHSILNVPCHGRRIAESSRQRTSWYFYSNEAAPKRPDWPGISVRPWMGRFSCEPDEI